MLSKKQKDILASVKSVSLLFGIVVLAILSHVNFFLKDGRPFLDHSAHYFFDGFLRPLNAVYELLVVFLQKVFPFLNYDSFFLYKMCHLFFLIPLIFFTYFSAKIIYGKVAALIAAFLVITFPDVLNIFRKSEINMQTACFLSLAVYVYLKSSFLQKKSYSLCFALVAFLFFVNHYGSLLYLTVMFCVFVLTSFFNKEKAGRDSVVLCFVVFFILAAIDFYFNPVRYESYFDKYTFYLFSHHVLTGNIFVSFVDNFAVRYFENARELYNSNLVFFDIHFLLCLFSVIFHIVCIVFKKIKKVSFSHQENMACQLLLVVLFGILFVLVGFSNIRKFAAPFYFFMAILNAGAFVSLYSRIKEKLFFRMAGLGFVVMFVFYGVMILFYSPLVFKFQNNTLNAYFYVQDDFNLSEVMSFVKKEKVGAADIGVMGYDAYSVSDAESCLLTLRFKMGAGIEDIATGTSCMIVFYDLLANNFFGNISEMEKVKAKINTFTKAKTGKEVELKKVLRYGVLLDDSMSFPSFFLDGEDASIFDVRDTQVRQYLIFIYSIGM